MQIEPLHPLLDEPQSSGEQSAIPTQQCQNRLKYANEDFATRWRWSSKSVEKELLDDPGATCRNLLQLPPSNLLQFSWDCTTISCLLLQHIWRRDLPKAIVSPHRCPECLLYQTMPDMLDRSFNGHGYICATYIYTRLLMRHRSSPSPWYADGETSGSFSQSHKRTRALAASNARSGTNTVIRGCSGGGGVKPTAI